MSSQNEKYYQWKCYGWYNTTIYNSLSFSLYIGCYVYIVYCIICVASFVCQLSTTKMLNNIEIQTLQKSISVIQTCWIASNSIQLNWFLFPNILFFALQFVLRLLLCVFQLYFQSFVNWSSAKEHSFNQIMWLIFSW